MDSIADIEQAVHELKVERDTWKAVACQYREAFEAQTNHFRELQHIHLILQAEYEKMKCQQERLLFTSHRSMGKPCNPVHHHDSAEQHQSFGTATIFSPPKFDKYQRQNSFADDVDPMFKPIQHLLSQRNYGMALAELDRLLHGRLISTTRLEGLLLKSDVLRAIGPEELYNALAACSEALELCDRLPDLNSFVTRLQFQRGIIYYQLRMLPQARESFGAINHNDLLFSKASEFRRSCEDELDHVLSATRRSGFDENRTVSEEYLAQFEDNSSSRRRRTSTQLRHAASKAKRLALPQRWATSKSDEH